MYRGGGGGGGGLESILGGPYRSQILLPPITTTHLRPTIPDFCRYVIKRP